MVPAGSGTTDQRTRMTERGVRGARPPGKTADHREATPPGVANRRRRAEDARFELARGCPQHAFQFFAWPYTGVMACRRPRSPSAGRGHAEHPRTGANETVSETTAARIGLFREAETLGGTSPRWARWPPPPNVSASSRPAQPETATDEIHRPSRTGLVEKSGVRSSVAVSASATSAREFPRDSGTGRECGRGLARICVRAGHSLGGTGETARFDLVPPVSPGQEMWWDSETGGTQAPGAQTRAASATSSHAATRPASSPTRAANVWTAAGRSAGGTVLRMATAPSYATSPATPRGSMSTSSAVPLVSTFCAEASPWHRPFVHVASRSLSTSSALARRADGAGDRPGARSIRWSPASSRERSQSARRGMSGVGAGLPAIRRKMSASGVTAALESRTSESLVPGVIRSITVHVPVSVAWTS